MDPSRIRLEDDRFGLIGVSFRPQNRATFLGMESGDYVWSIGIVVGDEDEIQTVEIDEHGAKSSRMLTPGELFEGLEILAAPGSEAYLVVGALTLLGMDLRASGSDTVHQFADVLRAAADDRGWRLPLHLIGQPRDLQLSSQGRDILRQTASALERDGQARTSLAAAQRLELSGSALDSVRRRIARKSLQAYRMHGRWYVVLDNLTRSRASEQNGTHEAAFAPSAPTEPVPGPSPYEEMPGGPAETETPEPATSEAAVEEAFVSVEEGAPEFAPQEITPSAPPVSDEAASSAGEAPTADELAAFVSEEAPTEQGLVTEEPAEEVLSEMAVSTQPEAAGEFRTSEAVAEERAAREALAREAGFYADTEATTIQPSEESEAEHAPEEPVAAQEAEIPVEPQPAAFPQAVDRLISETVLEQFIITEIDTFVRDVGPIDVQPSVDTGPEEEPSGHAEAQETGEEWQREISRAQPEPEAETVSAVETEGIEDRPVVAAEQHEIGPESSLPEEPGESVAGHEVSELMTTTEEAESAEVESLAEGAEAESVVNETTKYAPEPAGMPVEEEPQIAEAGERVESQMEQPATPRAEEPESFVESGVPEEGESYGQAAFAAAAESEREPTEPETVPESEAVAGEEQVESIEAGETTAEAEEESAAGGAGFEEPQRPAGKPQLEIGEDALGLLAHLQSEVAFLRQQGQEKDRQIVAWISGAQWLQPFVDQIRSLEQQVERLGDLQAQRDGDRITDLMSERDQLRERLAQLESKIESVRAAAAAPPPPPPARRSWFRRMMSSD